MTFSSNALNLCLQVLQGQLFMFFASTLIMSGAGATYVFAVYSKDIKSTLNYNQQTLNTISFFKDLGSNVGILSGLLTEVAPPFVVLLIGAAMNFVGYLMIYLSITGHVARPHVWQMCLYIAIGTNSQSFANTGTVVTCVHNFPENRGIILGLLKGFIGLSGAIFTQLYLAFYGDDSKSLVLLIAWLPAAISVAFIGTIRILKHRSRQFELKVLYSFLYLSLALAGYLMIMIIVEKRVSFSHSEYRASAAMILFLLLLPLVIVVKEEFALWKQKAQLVQTPPPPISMPIEPKSSRNSNSSRFISTFKAPERGEDYSIIQAIASIDMFILFFTSICGAGGSLAAIDNMGQIGESLGYPPRSIGAFVSLISIWNYLGRVAAGFASEILLTKYKFPRPLMLAMVLLLSCVGYLLIAFGVPGSLYVASIIIGFCFGAQNPLLVAITSEVFGLKHFSILFNFGSLASPIGSYILNVRVAGKLYDREAAKRMKADQVLGSLEKPLRCIGVQCFRLSFLVVTAATVLGAGVMLILVWRTWDFYRGDIYARYKEGVEGDTERNDSDL